MARRRLALTVLIAAFGLTAPAALAHPGDLDPTFSEDGFAQAGYPNNGRGTIAPFGVAQEPFGITADGDILVGGQRIYRDNCSHIGCFYGETRITVARLDPSGALDPAFGDAGVIESDLGLAPNGAGVGVGQASFAQAPDGGIVIATSDSPPEGGIAGFVARLSPSGELDGAFGAGGTRRLTFAPAVRINDVTVDRSGRILIAGQAQGAEFAPYNHDQDDFVARLLPDGSLDPSFGDGDGVSIVNLSLNDSVDRIALDSEGRIVAAADFFNFQPFTTDLSIFRLLEDGTLDRSFGTDGTARVDPRPDAGSNASVSALAIDAQDRPIVSTEVSVENGQGAERYLVRLDAGGEPDAAFGAGGLQSVAIPGDSDRSQLAYVVGSLLVQPDGALVVGGGTAVGRLLSNGAVDASFGRDGWTRLHPFVPSSFAGLMLDGAGRILVGGATAEPHSRAQIARLRVDAQGPPDADADGVTDVRDACRYAFGQPSGCPTTGRAVTLDTRAKNLLEGRVSSRSADCVTGTVVRIFAQRPGPDRRLGKPSVPIEYTTPADAGERTEEYWAVTRPRYEGRVYARIKRSVDADEGICGRARSRTVTLR